jgi:hypothetical protein
MFYPSPLPSVCLTVLFALPICLSASLPLYFFQGVAADITFVEAVSIPHVLQYSLAFGLFKFANYAM